MIFCVFIGKTRTLSIGHNVSLYGFDSSNLRNTEVRIRSHGHISCVQQRCTHVSECKSTMYTFWFSFWLKITILFPDMNSFFLLCEVLIVSLIATYLLHPRKNAIFDKYQRANRKIIEVASSSPFTSIIDIQA